VTFFSETQCSLQSALISRPAHDLCMRQFIDVFDLRRCWPLTFSSECTRQNNVKQQQWNYVRC